MKAYLVVLIIVVHAVFHVVLHTANASDWVEDASFSKAEASYQHAGEGDSDSVERALTEWNDLKNRHGNHPVIAVRIGSLTTMQARDAFAPWNKMKYAETGLDIIDRALDSLPNIVTKTDTVRGVAIELDVKLNAAITFSSMPKMFNRWNQAERLFNSIAATPGFDQQPTGFQIALWQHRIRHAKQREQTEEIKAWSERLNVLQSKASHADASKAEVARGTR